MYNLKITLNKSNKMTKSKRPEQRIVCFLDQEAEFEKIQKELENGWFIASLISNGRGFVGILERTRTDADEETIYIPPRKKIRFTI